MNMFNVIIIYECTMFCFNDTATFFKFHIKYTIYGFHKLTNQPNQNTSSYYFTQYLYVHVSWLYWVSQRSLSSYKIYSDDLMNHFYQHLLLTYTSQQKHCQIEFIQFIHKEHITDNTYDKQVLHNYRPLIRKSLYRKTNSLTQVWT